MSLTLQQLIERYINGDDDVEDTTAVPKHSSFGARKSHEVDGTNIDDDAKGGEDEDNAGDDSAVTYPIFIPSKGRYDITRQGTCALLARSRIPFTVVVEPQEAPHYRSFLSRLENYDPLLHGISVLPASDQGVSFARNYIAKHLVAPTGWFWQMDDDIRCFSQSFGNKKNTPITPRSFFKAFAERMKKYPTASLFSAEYEMFAFNYGPGDVAINSYNNIAKLFKRECMPEVGHSASYVPTSTPDTASSPSDVLSPPLFAADDVYRFKVREDYDMVLRMIEKGYCAVRFRDLSFRVPGMSELSGGMTDYYVKQRSDIREQNRMFVAAWPSVTREVLKGAGKDLRFDIKVNWAALNPSKGDPSAILRDRSANVDSLLISSEDAAVASRLKGKDVAVAKKSSWKRGEKNPKQPRTRARGAARSRKASKGKKRGRRGRDSDDDDDYSSQEDDSEEEGDFNSDDDEVSGDESSASSGDDGHSVDEDDGLSDEEAYFALMESFYRPHKVKPKKVTKEVINVDEDDNAVAQTVPMKAKGKKSATDGQLESNPVPTKTVPKKKVYVPKPKATPIPVEERKPTGWAGYALVRWRDVEPLAAAEVGLKHIDPIADPKAVAIGSSVAFVPLMYDIVPSVMVGTIISTHPEDHAVQIAPGRKYRGVPLQTIDIGRLYTADCDAAACAEKLDKILNSPADVVVQVTRSNVKSLMAEVK